MKLSFGLVEVKCPKCGVLSTYKVYSQKAAITIDTAQPDIS
jgi:phage FluMu protein Com